MPVLGPVLIDFPIDILFTPVDRPEKIAWGAIARPLPSLPGPSIEAIQEAVKLWKAAERPVIITSTGAHGSEVSRFYLPPLQSLISFPDRKAAPQTRRSNQNARLHQHQIQQYPAT